MKTFFLVDDHEMSLIGLTSIIEHNSQWKCIGTASSFSDAVSKFEKSETKPDVIIADINLNDKENEYIGIDLIKLILQKNPNQKIIVCSMFKNPNLIKQVSELGAKAYLSKNVSSEDIIKCMNDVYDGKNFISPDLIQGYSVYLSAINSLTKKEKEVFEKIMQNKSTRDIAFDMNLTDKTVENYYSRIYNKLGVISRSELMGKFK